MPGLWEESLETRCERIQ